MAAARGSAAGMCVSCGNPRGRCPAGAGGEAGPCVSLFLTPGLGEEKCWSAEG